MSTKNLSDLRDEGVTLGQSILDKVSMYGKTPVAQQSGANQAALGLSSTTTVTLATGIGAATMPLAIFLASEAANLVNAHNELRAVLVNLGAMKGSA